MILDPATAADAGIPGNEAAFKAIRGLFSDGPFARCVPFLLLPVRLETRFVQAEVPAPAIDPDHILQRLESARKALDAITALPLATEVLGKGARERERIKGEVEPRLRAAIDAQCSTVRRELDALADEARSCVEGQPADLARLKTGVGSVQGAFDAAAKHVGALRSEFHRAAVAQTFERLRSEHLAPALAAVRSGTLGALSLARALGGSRVAPRAARALGGIARVSDAGESPKAASALGAAALAYREVRGRLRAFEARLRRPLPSVIVRAARLAGDVTDAAQSADRITALLRSIPVLPPSWVRRLASRARRTAQAVRRLAEALEDEARIATPRAIELSRSARQVRQAAARIEQAVAAVPTKPEGLRLADVAVTTRVVDQLRVRIFPDDVAVHVHEADLTASEIASAKVFWRETFFAGTCEPVQRDAWRALCLKHGSRRAAHIAARMKPELERLPPDPGPVLDALTTLERRIDDVARAPGRKLRRLEEAGNTLALRVRNLRSTSPGVARHLTARLETVEAKLGALDSTFAPARADESDRSTLRSARHAAALARMQLGEIGAVAGTAGNPVPSLLTLVFPDLTPKDGAWTAPPTSRVLPERFVVVAVRNGKACHIVVGNPVDPRLCLGLDPSRQDPSKTPAEQEDERFQVVDGELQVGASIRWMVSYDDACAKGMAVTVPITLDDVRKGFDRVFVLGLKQADAAGGAALLSELLENHHYGAGLAFLPVGTPTNNTGDARSGFRSADDADASFDVERAAGLFDLAPASAAARSDGLRFAQALGINPELLQHIANAGARGVSEALTVNEALWPGTLGAYLEESFGGLLGLDAIARVRAFFLAHVLCRGFIPAFRVGDQPYGVLTTTAFSLLEPGAAAAGASAEEIAQARFRLLLRETLEIAHADWSRIRAAKVKHAGNPGKDAQQHFLDMLGVQASTAAWWYRIGANVEGRAPVLPPFTYSRQYPGAEGGAAVQGPFALLSRFAPVFRLAFGIEETELLKDGLVAPAYQGALGTLLDARPYQLRFFVHPKPLACDVSGLPSADVSQLLVLGPDDLRLDARKPRPSLLRQLVRNALLVAYRDAALRILRVEGLMTNDAWVRAGAEGHFLVKTILDEDDEVVTKWSYLLDPLSGLDGRLGLSYAGQSSDPGQSLYAYLNKGAQPIADYLSKRGETELFSKFAGPKRKEHVDAVSALQQHAGSVAELAQIPPDRLAQLVAEHVDLCSHRLDAWRLGSAHARLDECRAAHPAGVYLGAFGWVENLTADVREIATGVPPALQRAGEVIYQARGDNDGFVHAPSLSHAVTAAVLRSGYLSEAEQPDLENRMAVNLSSRRVRAALHVIDGIQAGSSLGSLLGYRLERALHASGEGGGPELDALIYPLRRAFPTLGAVAPDQAPPGDAARMVVDGAALLQTVRKALAERPAGADETLFEALRDGGHYTGYPWGIVERTKDREQAVLPAPPAETAQLDAFLRALDEVADVLDAVGDLSLAEGVFQSVRGNHARASAALQALAEGRAPPRPEIVETQRSGTLLTHRLLLSFDAADGAKLFARGEPQSDLRASNRRAAAPPGWEDVPMTPRACMEPSLNRWLGAMVGSARTIVGKVVAEDGTAREVSAATLCLQPLDLLALVGGGVRQAEAELGARMLALTALDVLPASGKAPGQRVVLERDGSWSPAARSFIEVAALLEPLQALLGKARAAHAIDLLDEAALGSGAPACAREELETRVRGAVDELQALGVELAAFLSAGAASAEAIADPQGTLDRYATVLRDGSGQPRDAAALFASRDAIRSLLARAASYGVPSVSPPSGYASGLEFARSALDRLEAAFREVASRANAAGERLGALASATDPVKALVEAVHAAFGDGFTVLPRFVVANPGPLRAAFDAKLAGEPSSGAVTRWLHGVAAVRERPRLLRQALVVADAFGCAAPPAGVAQLPMMDGDVWLGAALPQPTSPLSPKVSLVALGAASLRTDGGASAGLLVDEWHEVIPSPTETTGIALQYDQPGSTPPQALLLAVPPAASGTWTFEHLIQTLEDTLEAAKNRLVEPDHLADELYGHLLPGVVAELIPDAVKGAPVGARVVMDLGRSHRPKA